MDNYIVEAAILTFLLTSINAYFILQTYRRLNKELDLLIDIKIIALKTEIANMLFCHRTDHIIIQRMLKEIREKISVIEIEKKDNT